MRIRALLVAGLLFASPTASASGAYGEQIAGAMWLVKDGDQRRAFLAIGVRFLGPGVPVTLGMVATGPCRGTGHHLKCHLAAHARAIDEGDFVVDATMSTASLEMSTGRHEHSVTWTSDLREPSTYLESWSGPGYIEGWAGTYRTGSAEGSLFSRDLTRSDVESASIGAGASGDLQTMLATRSSDITARRQGGVWTLSF